MTDWNFATIWEAISDAQPDRLALAQGDRHRTWREWDDRSARLAAAFTELGLAHDGKVASYLYNSVEYLEGVFATWKCGAAPVNVNYRYLEHELRYLLENSDTDILLFHGVLGEHVAKVWRDVPTLKTIVQVDDGHPLVEGALRYEELVAGHDARRSHRALGRRPVHPLHRRYHRHAQGRDVAQRGPLPGAGADRARTLRCRAARRRRRTSAASRPRSPPPAARRCTCRPRRSCTAPGS